MSLKEYASKRDFKKTAEPTAELGAGAGMHRFVIQKHAASRLHYDFRLELDGTLKSWAVPKGVPFKKGERRLAVHVEDHPVSYIDFEGTIPAGQYGGGTVMVWDRGTFEPLTQSPLQDLKGGKLHVVLHGKKLNGEWYLVRLREGDEWLLIKGGEDAKPLSAKADGTSVLSGKTMAALAKGAGKVWPSNRREPKSFKTKVAELARATAEKPDKVSKRVGSNKTASKKRSAAARGDVGAKSRKAEAESNGSSTKNSKTRAVGPRSKAKASNPPAQKLAASSLTPAFIEPMKAQLVDTPPAGEWIYEIKFDGFRALAFRDRRGTRLRSRNNKDFAARFPEVLDAITALDVDDAVIDGEIVALDDKGRSSFQLLQAYDLGQERPPIFFMRSICSSSMGSTCRTDP